MFVAIGTVNTQKKLLCFNKHREQTHLVNLSFQFLLICICYYKEAFCLNIHQWIETITKCSTMPTIPNPNSPSWALLVVRKVLRLSTEHRYNSECWMISLHHKVLLNIQTTWHFQPSSPHQVLYTQSHVITFLTMEIHRNTLRISFYLCVYWLMISITDMKVFLVLYSYNIIFQYQFLDAFKCKMHSYFWNVMWKKNAS
jgi:hypothetical protein